MLFLKASNKQSATEDPRVGPFNIFISDMEAMMEYTLITFADDIKLGEHAWVQGCHSVEPRDRRISQQKHSEVEQEQVQILERKSPV